MRLKRQFCGPEMDVIAGEDDETGCQDKFDLCCNLVLCVDGHKCRGCGRCVESCPMGAVSFSVFAVIDSEKCIGCGACILCCPNNAIRYGRVRYS